MNCASLGVSLPNGRFTDHRRRERTQLDGRSRVKVLVAAGYHPRVTFFPHLVALPSCIDTGRRAKGAVGGRENVSLDSVVQDPTGEEGFRRGGWFLQMGDKDREAWAKLDKKPMRPHQHPQRW